MKRILIAGAWSVFVIAAAVGVAAAQTQSRFTLTGVVVVEGGGRAWLQEPVLTQNQPVALRPGESIGPYRLTKILDDRVEMMGPSGAIWVLLAGVQEAAAAPAPPPQPAPPKVRAVPGLQLEPPLAELPPGTPRVDFESLLRGVIPR